MSKFVWVKIEGSRAVEVEVTEIRNINALIQFLKIKFEVSSPEHLLVINQHGMEIPADSLVSNAVSTFKQPLELLALDRNSSDVPRYTSLGESSTTTSPRNEFEFMQTPPFFGNLHEAANRDYFKIPVKPLILIILFLETISTFNLMIWVSPLYVPFFFLNLLGFWATSQKKALYLSYYAWAQLLFLAPDVALDVIEFLRYMGKPADVIALFLLAIGFKYLLIGFYLFCIRKVWSKLNAPAVRLDVEEPLIPNST